MSPGHAQPCPACDHDAPGSPPLDVWWRVRGEPGSRLVVHFQLEMRLTSNVAQRNLLHPRINDTLESALLSIIGRLSSLQRLNKH